MLDDLAARRAATDQGLSIPGTLGILDQAATMGLVDIAVALQRLQQTTFRASSSFI